MNVALNIKMECQNTEEKHTENLICALMKKCNEHKPKFNFLDMKLKYRWTSLNMHVEVD